MMINNNKPFYMVLAGMLGESDVPSDIQEVAGSILGSGHRFVEIGHEIISTAILSLPLIQEGQLSVTGENYGHCNCTG